MLESLHSLRADLQSFRVLWPSSVFRRQLTKRQSLENFGGGGRKLVVILAIMASSLMPHSNDHTPRSFED